MLADIFADRHEPLFLNEGSFQSELVLQKMEALRTIVSTNDAGRLERDIALLRSGIAGERRVAFELKNAHYPLVFLHDLNIAHEGTSAQVDFLVISPTNAFVLECKNLVGDIEVQGDGTFVRTFGTGTRKHSEAIYSPITQNTRHVELMKAIIRSENGKLLGRLFGGTLDTYFHSVVVLANEKSMLSMANAPKDVRSQVIRCDQLVEHIKRLDRIHEKKNGRDSFDQMRRNAQGWLKRSKHLRVDLTDKYEISRTRDDESDTKQSPANEDAHRDKPSVARTRNEGMGQSLPLPVIPVPTATPACPVCGSPMQLRKARYGPHKGEQFWGCSTYWTTRCPGIVPTGRQGG